MERNPIKVDKVDQKLVDAISKLKKDNNITDQQIQYIFQTKGEGIMQGLLEIALSDKNLEDLPQDITPVEKIVTLKFIRVLRKGDFFNVS